MDYFKKLSLITCNSILLSNNINAELDDCMEIWVDGELISFITPQQKFTIQVEKKEIDFDNVDNIYLRNYFKKILDKKEKNINNYDINLEKKKKTQKIKLRKTKYEKDSKVEINYYEEGDKVLNTYVYNFTMSEAAKKRMAMCKVYDVVNFNVIIFLDGVKNEQLSKQITDQMNGFIKDKKGTSNIKETHIYSGKFHVKPSNIDVLEKGINISTFWSKKSWNARSSALRNIIKESVNISFIGENDFVIKLKNVDDKQSKCDEEITINLRSLVDMTNFVPPAPPQAGEKIDVIELPKPKEEEGLNPNDEGSKTDEGPKTDEEGPKQEKGQNEEQVLNNPEELERGTGTKESKKIKRGGFSCKSKENKKKSGPCSKKEEKK